VREYMHTTRNGVRERERERDLPQTASDGAVGWVTIQGNQAGPRVLPNFRTNNFPTQAAWCIFGADPEQNRREVSKCCRLPVITLLP